MRLPRMDRLWPRILFKPTRHVIACRKLERRLDHLQLWGALQGDGEAPELLVLRLLGARGRAELATLDPVDRIPEISAQVWTLNPPSFGGSVGTRSTQHYLDATLRAFDYLREVWPTVPVWVYGKSIGTCGALHIAANRHPSAVVLKNVLSVPDLLARRMPVAVGRWLAPSGSDLCALSLRAQCKALFVVSKGDNLSPATMQHRVIDAYAGRAHVLEVEGDHDDAALSAADAPRYRDAIARLWRSHSS